MHVKSCSQFHFARDKLLKLRKPLYGLEESGDYCHRTLKTHLRRDIGMKACITNPALYYKGNNGTLSGYCGTYVDDRFHAEREDYAKEPEVTEKMFQC